MARFVSYIERMNPTKVYGIVLLLVLLWGHGGVLAQDTLYAKYGLHTISTIKTYDSLVVKDPNQALVELDKFIPGIVLDIKYATSGNLMHRPVYKTAQAFLRLPAAEALKAVALELRPMGYGLKIYDGYRPYRVTVAFYEQYHDTNFVASPYTGSRHNRGCAVDLTLIDLKTGKELSMPTPFDSFDKTAAANYAALPPAVLKNRALLQRVMGTHGFLTLPSEWWHFDFAGWQQYPVTDIPFEELETSASAAGPSRP
jgi:zinc D-Ala-D-Ala dipeptidase